MHAKQRILELARAEGFPLVRVAGAGTLLPARAAALDALGAGRLAGMAWMTEEWLTRATDPGQFLEGARSVVLLALPYGPSPPGPLSRGAGEGEDGPARGRIAQYAQGRDYHRVFEKKLRRIAASIRAEFGARARATVDYGPLLERPLAAVSGMGWQGKSTMLLAPGFGPWVLLGAIATSLDLEADEPLKKSCGSCRRCIVACPTGAIAAGGHVLDARLCISYHTIENRGAIPRGLRAKFGGWIFGCDDCLDACPVGAAHTGAYPDFAAPTAGDARPELAPLLMLDEAAFAERFRGRAIMRAKRDGFLRNVCVALGNVGGIADVGGLAGALGDVSPLVRAHAAWALGRLAERLPAEKAGVLAALRERQATEEDPAVRVEVDLALGAAEGRGPG
jgi:epoxyqueuosine reductase